MSDVNLTEKQKDELDMLTVAIEREEGLNDEYHNKVHSFIVKYVDKFRLANGADSKTANCAIFDVMASVSDELLLKAGKYEDEANADIETEGVQHNLNLGRYDGLMMAVQEINKHLP